MLCVLTSAENKLGVLSNSSMHAGLLFTALRQFFYSKNIQASVTVLSVHFEQVFQPI